MRNLYLEFYNILNDKEKQTLKNNFLKCDNFVVKDYLKHYEENQIGIDEYIERDLGKSLVLFFSTVEQDLEDEIKQLDRIERFVAKYMYDTFCRLISEDVRRDKPSVKLYLKDLFEVKDDNYFTFALVGMHGVGKSSTCNFLQNVFCFKHLSFSRYLKELCAQLSKLDINFFESHDYKDKPLESLIVLSEQELDFLCGEVGLEKSEELKNTLLSKAFSSPREITLVVLELIKKNKGKDFFAKKALENIPNSCDIVISDLRFVEELEELRNKTKNLKIIYINNERIKEESQHSIYDIKEIKNQADYILNNNGDLNELKKNIVEMYKQLTNRNLSFLEG